MFKFKIFILSLLLSIFSLIHAQETEQEMPQLYHQEKDGNWLPFTYLANGTFDVIQNPYWFSQDNYGHKMKTFWNRIKDPVNNVEKDGGFKKLVQNEFIGSSRVFPNIGLHMVGGAYDTLWLRQYFEYHEVPLADVFAFLFTFAAHAGNEALETTQTEEIDSHDHIADIYFWDVAAFLLSYSKTGMNFLINDLGMEQWHFNPMYDLNNDDFFNTGLNYVFRPKALSFDDGKWRPMLFMGMQTMAGLSYNYNSDSTISGSAGMSLTNPLKQKGRFVTALFHEYQGNLEASLFLNGSEDYRWRLNLYDIFFNRFEKDLFEDTSTYRLSVMLGQQKGAHYAAGINLNLPVGLGFIDK